MVSRLLYFFISIFLTASVYGQSIDRLLLDYGSATDSLVRVEIEQKLAAAYQRQQAYSRAVEFYKKVLKSKQGDTLQVQKIRTNLIICYNELGDNKSEI